MKNIIILLITTLILNGCENSNNKPETELEKLPPVTQTGADTVGCLLDGKAFKPGLLQNAVNCFYQYVNGEYYFALSFKNKDSNFNLTALGVGTQKLQIKQGNTYDLVEFSDYNADGAYTYNINENFTTHTHTGKLSITKLDSINGIVSGTFWYDVQDQNNVVHQIREGRFDMHYTN